MNIKDIWSITGDRTRDALLFLPIGVLVIVLALTYPAADKATPAFYGAVALGVVYLVVLMVLWARHLAKLARGKR